MTQAEIEAKLESLSEQLSQLHKQQENRNKIWILVGSLSLFFGLGYMIAGAMMDVTWGLIATPLIFLSVALLLGADKTAIVGRSR